MKQLWLAGLFALLLFSPTAFADVVTGSQLDLAPEKRTP
jgi:hypothetical protein